MALDMLTMLAGMRGDDAGQEFTYEPVTAPGVANVELPTLGDAGDEKTSPDALAGLSLRELLAL